MNPINGMMDFIRQSPTAFHAVANLQEMLKGQGFNR